MSDLDFGLKMHKSTFSIDEDMSNFIRDNFDNSKERLDFLQGGFKDYIPEFHTPKRYFNKIFDLLFDAYERKEPFLVKLLSAKNVEKMLDITKRVNGVDDLSLTSSSWLNLKDSVNYDDSFGSNYLFADPRMKGLLTPGEKKFDNLFRDFMFCLAGNQLLNTPIDDYSSKDSLLNLENVNVFTKSVLCASNRLAEIYKDKPKSEIGSKENNVLALCLTGQNYNFLTLINLCETKNINFYDYYSPSDFEKSIMNMTGGFKQNLGQYLLKKQYSALFDSDVDVSKKGENFKKCKEKVIGSLHKDIIKISFDDDSQMPISFRDFILELMIPQTRRRINESGELYNQKMEFLDFVLSDLNKEFAYNQKNETSIKFFLDTVEKGSAFKLAKFNEKILDLLSFHPMNLVGQVAKEKSNVSNPILVKALIENKLLNAGIVYKADNDNDTLVPGVSFKI